MAHKFTAEQFMAALRDGPYADGGYPLFFVTADGESLSYSTAYAERAAISKAIRLGEGSAVIAREVNWENPELYDDISGDRIESAYAEEGLEPVRASAEYRRWLKRPQVVRRGDERKPNPETSTVVGVGLAVAVLGVLGWLGYKAFSGSGTTTPASGPLSALPHFNPVSTDMEQGYTIAVFATAPVTLDHDAVQGKSVTPYLEQLPIDHIVVGGPFTKKTAPPPPMDPMPSLVLAVDMRGNIVGGMTREEAEALKALMGSK